MTDDFEKAQNILSGRCIECGEVLPSHTNQCSKNVIARAIEKLDAINWGLGDLVERGRTVVHNSAATPEQIQEVINEIKSKKPDV